MAWIGDDYEVNRRSGFENPLRLFRFLPLFAEFEDTAGHVARDVARFAQPGAALVEATDDLVDRILPDLQFVQASSQSQRAEELFGGADRPVDALVLEPSRIPNTRSPYCRIFPFFCSRITLIRAGSTTTRVCPCVTPCRAVSSCPIMWVAQSCGTPMAMKPFSPIVAQSMKLAIWS